METIQFLINLIFRANQLELTRIQTMVGIINLSVIIISVILVLIQLHRHNQQMKVDISTKSVEYYSEIVKYEVDKKLEDIFLENVFLKNQNGIDTRFPYLQPAQKDTYHFLGLLLGYYEHLFHLHKNHLIDEDAWKAWENWLTDRILTIELFGVFWEYEQIFYREGFIKYINKIARPKAQERMKAGPKAIQAHAM